MVDFHSHILPGIDDGSKNVSESLKLLKMLSAQGIKVVAATPHFYPEDESLENFLLRRRDSYRKLKPLLSEDSPRIRLGAEVYYYKGISRLYGLQSLCLKGSRLLLLEMPSAPWTEYTLRELISLASSGEFKVALAHIERYSRYQKPEIWDRLLAAGLIMQANASFFLDWKTRRKAISLLSSDRIQLIGSDCHNMTSRPPQIGEAFEQISEKLGDSFMNHLIGLWKSLFV